MLFALAMTTVAGVATLIGGLMALHKSFENRAVLAFALAFSAGAMIYVSLTDILAKSLDVFSRTSEASVAYGLMSLAFFCGIALLLMLDKLTPKDMNLNDQSGQIPPQKMAKKRLMRGGVVIGLALTLHNFPEGFLVFSSILDNPATGVAIAFALAIHNIPEGIAIAAPLYAATKNKLKTLLITGATGLAEPIGALVGYLLLRDFLNGPVLGWVFGIVAGMMVFICIDEILPAAKRLETRQRLTTYGVFTGMAVLAISITFLQ